jgi:glyoxylase-like metal-dependent hydrolase (beta-lactamase superfamily II)
MLAALAATSALPQMSQPMISENTTKTSDHVFAIMGFPNTAIVVGSHATLVVDTGLGPKNGATAARVAAKLAPNNSKLFLTTTHFHPEHAAGEPGFPPGTILIRDAVQQQEMEKHGQEMIDMFSQRSQQNKDLLRELCIAPARCDFRSGGDDRSWRGHGPPALVSAEPTRKATSSHLSSRTAR